MMLALEMYRSLPRHVAGKAIGGRVPGLLSGYAAPLRLMTIDEPAIERPGLGPAAHPPVRHLRLRPGRAVRPDQPLLLRRGVDAVRARPRGRGRAARRLRGPARRRPRGDRPGAHLRGPRRRAVRRLRGRRHQPLQPDHRRPPRARAADRLLRRHRRWLGRGAHRAPQPAARRARGLLRRAGRAHRADGLRGAHRAPRRRRRQRPGAGQRRRLGRPAHDAGPAQPHRGRRDHGRRQARPPARAGAPARRHRGGGAGRGAAPAAPGHAVRSRSSPSAPRRTSSAGSTSRSTRSAASSRWRPPCTRPGPAAASCCRGCRRRPTCPRRGSASWRWSAPTPRHSTRPGSTAGARSTWRPSCWPATR